MRYSPLVAPTAGAKSPLVPGPVRPYRVHPFRLSCGFSAAPVGNTGTIEYALLRPLHPLDVLVGLVDGVRLLTLTTRFGRSQNRPDLHIRSRYNAMAFIPVPNTAKVELLYTVAEQVVENVFHVEGPAAWTATTLTQLAQAFASWWSEELGPAQSQDVNALIIKARDLTTEAAPGIEFTGLFTGQGGILSPIMPGNVTLAIKWVTGLIGRSQRGRTFHIGLAESQCAGNRCATGVEAALATIYGTLITRLAQEVVTWALVVVSYVSNGVPRTTGQTTPITNANAEPFIDSQRRRLTGRGQ